MQQRARGFTLIELAIGIAIVGVLVALGIPAYSGWVQNQQIRNRAESIHSGLQIARAESIRLNTTVEFVMTDSNVAAGNANSLAPSTSGRNWMVRQYRRVSNDYVFLQSAYGNDGTKHADVTTTPPASTATFDGFGRVSVNDDGSDSLQRVDVDSSKIAAAQSRDLRILITGGGSSRLCDPNVSAPDPRRCVL